MRGPAVGVLVATVVFPFGTGCGGCGDDDGASLDGADGFVLVERTPLPDDDDVWTFAPIVLVFSQAVDAETVTDETIALSVGSTPLAHDTEISPDGIGVTLTITEAPTLPADVTISVGTDLRSEAGDAFAGDSWSFTLPIWQHPETAGALTDGATPRMAIDPRNLILVALTTPDGIQVRRLEREAWSDVGEPLEGSDARLVVTGDEPLLSLRSGNTVEVRAMSDDAWQAPTTPFSDPVTDHDLIIDSQGQPIAAATTAGEVQVSRWTDGAWQALPPVPVSGASQISIGAAATTIVVAVIGASGALRVFRQGIGAESAWVELVGGIDRTAAELPHVAAVGGAIGVSWQKDDGGQLATRHVFAATWDSDTWRLDAHAADLDIQTDAVNSSLAFDALGNTILAWSEGDTESRKVYVARAGTSDASWAFMDSAINSDLSANAEQPSIVLDLQSNPVVAYREDGNLMVARWNGSPTRRHGLEARPTGGACGIPDADALPTTLAATGCYADVASHQLAPQLIPFDINSPLWSDGALKRRFMLVPDGASLGYTESGALTVPMGTLLVKEFWLERVADDPTTRFPVETRFLVKRCEEGDCLEPWQGYSYRWRPDGSEADLIDPGSTDERTDWPLTSAGGVDTVHTHIYPARLNCTRCHNAVAGRVLGLQAVQLDRPVRYGAIIDNQLDTLAAIGVLTGLPSTRPARLPSSLDPSFDAEARSRAYFHTNCAHCHRPAGERPTIDFRFEAPLAVDNICDKLTPGDGTGSLIYVRDSTRGAGQMPPLATDAVDTYQLGVTAAWIDGLSSCP